MQLPELLPEPRPGSLPEAFTRPQILALEASPTPVTDLVSRDKDSEAKVLGLSSKCIGFNFLGILILASQLGFGLYMGAASSDAMKFLISLRTKSDWIAVEREINIFLTVNGLLTGIGTGLASFNIPKVLERTRRNWYGDPDKPHDKKKKLSFCVMSVNCILNCVLWAGLSLAAVLGLNAYGLEGASLWTLGLLLGFGDFLNFFLINIEDIVAAPNNFSEFRGDWKATFEPSSWLARSIVNVLIKSMRQGFIAMAGIALLARQPLSSGLSLFSGSVFFLIAAYETFFTQCYAERIRKRNEEAAPTALALVSTDTFPAPASVPFASAPRAPIFKLVEYCKKLKSPIFWWGCFENIVLASIGLSLILTNGGFCAGLMAEDPRGVEKWFKLAVMLLGQALTGMLVIPQPLGFLKPKIREGALYIGEGLTTALSSCTRVCIRIRPFKRLPSSASSSFNLDVPSPVSAPGGVPQPLSSPNLIMFSGVPSPVSNEFKPIASPGTEAPEIGFPIV